MSSPDSRPSLFGGWKPDRRFFIIGGFATAVVWGVFGFLLLSSSSSQAATPGDLIIFPTSADALVLVTPTADPAATEPPTPVAEPSPVLAYIPQGGPPALVDYGPMLDEVNALIRQKSYDVGAAFVDDVTGQVLTMGRGEGKFHAMSTFKGPLAAYYLWLSERGQIEEGAQDDFHIRQMLDWSSNVDTTCVFQMVGGIAPFNDWLADQGLDRKNNWVYGWESWPCYDISGYYVPDYDYRYRDGDQGLGLPGGKALMVCPDSTVPCDKSIQPVALAIFYARLYQGQILTPSSLRRWLDWVEKPLPITSMFDSLPPEAAGVVHAYAKNGTHPAEPDYDLNVYHEAGLLTTPQGTFALAVFMQGNPEYRGTEIHGQIGRIVYDAFVAAHANDGR